MSSEKYSLKFIFSEDAAMINLLIFGSQKIRHTLRKAKS